MRISPGADLERIEEQFSFQRGEWVFQRIGWGFLAAIILAALAGLLGNGPWSHRTLKSADGRLAVDLDHFLHLEAAASLMVHVEGSRQGELTELWLSGEFLRNVQVERITPQPQSNVTTQDGVSYRFAVEGDALTVRLSFRPQVIGRLRCRIQSEGQAVDLAQFVYP